MPLKKNYDLSDGALVDANTGFDSETDVNLLGALSTTTPLCSSNNNYYSVQTGVTSGQVAYLTDVVSPNMQAFHGTFKFRMDNTNVVNSARNITLLKGDGAATDEFKLFLRSVSGGELDQLTVWYRDGASAQQSVSFVMPAITIQDGVIHTFKFQWKAGQPDVSNSGIIIVSIDDGADNFTTYINEQALDIGSARYINTVNFGVVEKTITVDRLIDVGCLQLSTNGDYTTDAYTYHIDSDTGSETNDGSEASPFKYSLQANQGAVGGDTIKLADRGVHNPHRLIDMGQIAPVNNGSVNNNIYIDGESKAQHTTILCSKDYSESAWVESSVSGEYYLNVNEVDVDPNRIYVCLKTAWTASGIDALDSDAIRAAGTVGLLTVGTYDYGDNDTLGFNAVYYKPKVGENIENIHIEIPRAVSANNNGIQFDTDWFVSRFINVKYAIASGIVNATNGAGSFCTHCSSTDNWSFGIATFAGMTIHKSVASWTRNVGDGLHATNGTGDILASVAHNNANDGISFAGTHVADCDGNLSFNNGYENAIGDNSGIEITTTAVIRARHNICVGNYGLGVLQQSSIAAGQELEDNICAFNGGHGYNISATHAATLLDGNASYGNGLNAFNLVGTGSVSPSNTVLTDPLFTNVDTTQGMTTNNNNREDEDFTLLTGSPCTDTTDAGTIVQNSWLAANESPPELQIGCAKARRGSMGCYR